MVRVDLRTYEALRAEKLHIEAMRELGHYPLIPHTDKHGVPLTDVIRHALKELADHRERSRKSARKQAKELLDRIDGKGDQGRGEAE